jgi:PAS domain-containing protein
MMENLKVRYVLTFKSPGGGSNVTHTLRISAVFKSITRSAGLWKSWRSKDSNRSFPSIFGIVMTKLPSVAARSSRASGPSSKTSCPTKVSRRTALLRWTPAIGRSNPLSRGAEPLGVFSTYFQQPHRPLEIELRFTDLYARLAAEVIERQRAEESLRASEARFRSLLEVLPAAACSCDAAGYITFFNEAAAAPWGRRPELQIEHWCGSLRIFRPDGRPYR